MKENKIAHHYSLFFFNLCKGDEGRREVAQDVTFLQALGRQNIFSKFLTNPLHAPSKQKNVLARLLQPHITPLTWAFLQLLLQKKRLPYLVPILDSFFAHYHTHQKAGRASLTVAHPLSAQEETKLSRAIKKLTGWQEVKLTVSRDPSLLGGYLLALDHKQLDLSLRGRLAALQRFWQRKPEEYILVE